MDKYKIKLKDFLENPTNRMVDINTRKISLEEIQPIVILSDETSDAGAIYKLIEELTNRHIEFYLNPSDIETPLKGYPLNLREIQLIY